MDTVFLIRRLHEHRIWSKNQFIAACEPLEHEQLTRSFAIGQGSIWATLMHLYAADYVWLEALLGNESPLLPGDLPNHLPGNQLGSSLIQSLPELVDHWVSLDVRWREFLAQLDASQLERNVAKVSTSSGLGKRYLTPAYDVLLHLCTHSQYTLAQANNMLRHTGVDTVPDLMLITLSRQ
jgi:uncharacterized damage-inducible protein DinB